MRGLLQEISALSRGVADRTTMDVAVDDKGAPMHKILNEVQKCFLRRYKRCLVVYHSARCDRIENMRWNTGAVLPAGKRDNLHATEVDYFKAYSGAVSRYLDGCKIDLTAVRGRGVALAQPRARDSYLAAPRMHYTNPQPLQSLKPPKLDRVPAQAIADCGVVQTASGPRNVNKGETHFMSRSEVEPLVRQGLMIQVPWD